MYMHAYIFHINIYMFMYIHTHIHIRSISKILDKSVLYLLRRNKFSSELTFENVYQSVTGVTVEV